MDLTKKHCKPCEGGVTPYHKQNAQAYLKNLDGWSISRDNKNIFKELTFPNFVEVITFVHRVANLAEEEGHHPDMNIHSYKKLIITLSTHAIGGLSENDFILAAKIDALER